MEASWSELKTKLNSVGPPQKDVISWKKIWSDWKGIIRKKIAHNKRESICTGGGVFNKFVLTPTEEAIATICDIHRAVDGIQNAISFGVVESAENCEEGEVMLEVGGEEENCTILEEPLSTSVGPLTEKRMRVDTIQQCLISNITEEVGTLKNMCASIKSNTKILQENNSGIRRNFKSLEDE